MGYGLTLKEKILELIRATLAFGALLEADRRITGRFSLEGGLFHFIANDRLLVANNQTAFAKLRPDLEAAAAVIYPDQTLSVTRLLNNPRDRLTIVVETGATLDMQLLLDRIKVSV